MSLLENILVGIIALEHCFILYIEMFAWKKMGPKIVKGMSPEFLEESSGMAANQGLYNGFLAAGLIWSILLSKDVWAQNIAVFFLGCVLIAGVYGGFRSSRSILFKQALPGALVLAAVLLIH